jgi:lipopolysaccharide export LptBFGC system permease protein LptF
VTGLDQGVADTNSTGPILNTTREVTGSGGSTSKTVEFIYQDPNNRTDNLEVTIHEAGNPSNSFRDFDAAVTALPLGTFKFTETFSGVPANTTLVANVTLTRGGETITRTISFGASQQPIGIPLGSGWTQIFGVGFLVVLGGIFSIGNARIGALVIPGVAFVLNVTGILSGVVTLAGVGIAFAVAVGYNVVVASASGGLATR